MTSQEFERAVDIYADDVYRIAYGSTRCREDSEDITQDVFAKLWQVRDRFVPESDDHLKYWLIRVTINRTNSLWRSLTRHSTVALWKISER
ncbi:RNA polymerase sigma factor, sigma-70 family [Ruminococcaceae bacterium YRB3002]|nr:RNA polymerase sigma factor, sigma-70 family [Ruminococcaceae bacterium YRB3002]